MLPNHTSNFSESKKKSEILDPSQIFSREEFVSFFNKTFSQKQKDLPSVTPKISNHEERILFLYNFIEKNFAIKSPDDLKDKFSFGFEACSLFSVRLESIFTKILKIKKIHSFLSKNGDSFLITGLKDKLDLFYDRFGQVLNVLEASFIGQTERNRLQIEKTGKYSESGYDWMIDHRKLKKSPSVQYELVNGIENELEEMFRDVFRNKIIIGVIETCVVFQEIAKSCLYESVIVMGLVKRDYFQVFAFCWNLISIQKSVLDEEKVGMEYCIDTSEVSTKCTTWKIVDCVHKQFFPDVNDFAVTNLPFEDSMQMQMYGKSDSLSPRSSQKRKKELFLDHSDFLVRLITFKNEENKLVRLRSMKFDSSLLMFEKNDDEKRRNMSGKIELKENNIVEFVYVVSEEIEIEMSLFKCDDDGNDEDVESLKDFYLLEKSKKKKNDYNSRMIKRFRKDKNEINWKFLVCFPSAKQKYNLVVGLRNKNGFRKKYCCFNFSLLSSCEVKQRYFPSVECSVSYKHHIMNVKITDGLIKIRENDNHKIEIPFEAKKGKKWEITIQEYKSKSFGVLKDFSEKDCELKIDDEEEGDFKVEKEEVILYKVALNLENVGLYFVRIFPFSMEQKPIVYKIQVEKDTDKIKSIHDIYDVRVREKVFLE